MGYSIMLQLVVGTTLILVGAGACFGWLQTRPTEETTASCLTEDQGSEMPSRAL